MRQRLGRAPGLVFNAVVLAAMIGMLVAASTPTIDLAFVGGWPTIVLFVTFCVWLIRVCQRKYAAPPSDWRTSNRWFLVPFVAGWLMVALIIFDVPFRARWPLAQPQFAAAAREVTASGDDAWQPVPNRSIAGFPIADAYRDGETVWFRYTGSSGFIDPHSRYVVYAPGNLDPITDWCYCSSVTPLGDGWYYLHDYAD